MSKMVKITLHVIDHDYQFGEAVGRDFSIHEALCQAVHEGNAEAWEYLQNNVESIDLDVEGN